jgi:ribosomal protein L37AE/L43A
MPAIYQGRCTICDAVTPTTSGFYQALFVDEPAGPRHGHPDDPHLVVLAHPIEALILEEFGCTYESASWGGRLVQVHEVFCRSCGQMFEIRRLNAGMSVFGCLGLSAVAAVTAVGLGIFVGRNWVGYVAGWVTWLATWLLLFTTVDSGIGWYIRKRYSERAARVATPSCCPQCGSRRYARVKSFWSRVPCTACGQRAVRFHLVAFS